MAIKESSYAIGLGIVLACVAASLSPAFAQDRPGTATLNEISYQPAGDGGVVQFQIAGPLRAFSCAVPAQGSTDLVVDLPEAGTRLADRIDLKNTLVPAASILTGPTGGAGVQVKLALGRGLLTRIERSEHGLTLRFARQADPGKGEYRVGAGDKIEINVFGHDDLSKIVEVRVDGSINYPLIGDLRVAGKTVAEIDGEVTQILGKDYLVDPQVSVDVKEYESQWVTIIGEVRTPGKYVLKRNMRLIDVLAEAGGASKEAGAQILITRQGQDGSPGQIVVDRDRLLSQNNQESNVLLQHGDIIAVGEKEVFYIRGEVTKPGAYLLESGMTILKAISLAGGFTQFANRKQVDVLRAGGGGVQSKVTVNVKSIEDGKKEDLPILPNDTIIVPRRIF